MKKITLLIAFVVFSGCATTQLPANLSSAILNSDDLQTVRDGLPAYLLMVDALVETYPKSESLRLTSASLNGSYGGVFVPSSQPDRQKRLTAKAFEQSSIAFCLYDKKACGLSDLRPIELESSLSQWSSPKDLPYLYALGTTWASYIQAHSDDWLIIAQLGKAEAVLKQLVTIDAEYEKGMALLYLGVMNSILPPSLGGKPDVAQDYYERALVAGNEGNLIIYVYYASNFARLMFDQELHDSLLQRALSLDPYVDGYTLQNVFALDQAKQLLATSNDYF